MPSFDVSGGLSCGCCGDGMRGPVIHIQRMTDQRRGPAIDPVRSLASLADTARDDVPDTDRAILRLLPGESRGPPFRCSKRGKMGPGFRRETDEMA
jgi:hypothetical protein